MKSAAKTQTNNESSTGKKVRILIAEDHEIVREGIKMLIMTHNDLEIIGEAQNGEDAVAAALDLEPDLVLIDVSMPVMNGLMAAKKIRAASKKVKILTLTRHTDDGYLRQLINAGANGYVLKQSAPSELITAIRTVAEGNSYIDKSLTRQVLGGYAAKHEGLRGERKGDLTRREVEVLRLTSLGYSNKEIAARAELSVKTIEAHKANAMRKLGISSRIDVVKYAILQNWLEEDGSN